MTFFFILDGAADISIGGYRMPLPNVYPTLSPEDEDDHADIPSKEEEPSIGAQEYAFDSVKVPLAENMFWVSYLFASLHFSSDSFVNNNQERKILLDKTLFCVIQFISHNDVIMGSQTYSIV